MEKVRSHANERQPGKPEQAYAGLLYAPSELQILFRPCHGADILARERLFVPTSRISGINICMLEDKEVVYYRKVIIHIFHVYHNNDQELVGISMTHGNQNKE